MKITNIAATMAVTFMTICPTLISAQDRLITKEGDVLLGFNVEVGEKTVFYSETNDANAPIKRIAKDLLLLIRKENGEKINFTAPTTPAQENVTPQASAQSAPQAVPLSPEAEARNKELIAKYNTDEIEYTNAKKKEKGRGAEEAFCQFFATPESQFCDNNIEVEYSLGKVSYEFINKGLTHNRDMKIKAHYHRDFWSMSVITDYTIKVTIKNKSNKPLFIDLGNSFFIRQGQAQPYYIPTATSTGTHSSGGGALGLGGVAGALGVGGAAGQILGGATIGGSKGVSTSTTIYSQRVISIPPRSTADLEPKAFKPCDKMQEDYLGAYNGTAISHFSDYYGRCYWPEEREEEMKEGSIWLYNEADPYTEYIPRFGTFITYSQEETLSNPQTLNAEFYLGKLIGGEEDDLTPNYKEVIGFELELTDKEPQK